jgi:hypothetical protein
MLKEICLIKFKEKLRELQVFFFEKKSTKKG